jgi:hypothetical protein
MSVVINGSAGVTTNSGAVYNGIAAGTAVASTSGTSIDFTSIPSWVKRITVMFSGVSTSGTNDIVIQIGAGSLVTTGYVSSVSISNTSSVSVANYSTGFGTVNTGAASDSVSGIAVLTTLGSNIWVQQGTMRSTTVRMSMGAGTLTLGGTLDRIRITGAAGSDTFDAGSINILYE